MTDAYAGHFDGRCLFLVFQMTDPAVGIPADLEQRLRSPLQVYFLVADSHGCATLQDN